MSPRNLDIKPSARAPKKAANDWIEDTEPAPAPPVEKEPNKKLSLEIPESVHHAHKVGVATRKNTMVSEVIEMMSARNGLIPWPADVVEQVKAQIAEEAADAEAETEPKTPATPRTRRTTAKGA